ncbi:MAG: flagellar basal body rod protein FlgB [Ignavibacteriaceae bacterium]|nr:flagellar basal body rod protein FlgB [Ignavibacteriaceae bacterium]
MSISTIKLLENFVDYCATKNKVISQNISNIGTTNYQRKDVEFKDILSGNINTVLKTSEEKHFVTGNIDNSGTPDFNIVKSAGNENESGVNNVDIDKEMADLAKNSLNFSFAAKKINAYFKDIQGVIKSGGAA